MTKKCILMSQAVDSLWTCEVQYDKNVVFLLEYDKNVVLAAIDGSMIAQTHSPPMSPTCHHNAQDGSGWTNGKHWGYRRYYKVFQVLT